MTDIQSVAEDLAAILQAGSPEHRHHAGPTLDRLAQLARAGELEEITGVVNAHLALHPLDRNALRRYLPGIIHNQYFYERQQRSQKALMRWRAATSDYAARLNQAVANPTRFALVVGAMDEEIKRAEIG